jgi:hypothetical protein
MAHPPPGPFRSRQQAEEVFEAARRGAESGTFGTRADFLTGYLADSIDVHGAELGDYDLALIRRLAELLDAVDVAVVASWFYRVAHDEYDQAEHIVTGPITRPRKPEK